jgi:flagellar P-ring protein precursor FlgI
MVGVILLAAALFGAPEAQAARVKDVASLYGARENMLIGYGLVTGLNRTGDTLQNKASIRALVNRLQGMGFTVTPQEVMARNVAVVMVTARLPAHARSGHQVDVEVSSTGDATSLEGGVLQFTPLAAPDGEVYATAQGPLVIGGFNAGQAGSAARKNFPNTGRVPQGAIVEKDNPNRLQIEKLQSLEWIVNSPDFTTALRLADAINDAFDEDIAKPRDGGTVVVTVPPRYLQRQVELIAEIERVNLTPDAMARVVVNERTGTVVVGADVRISPVAVAHGGLSIQVAQDNAVSQPNAFGRGRTAGTQNAQVEATEEGGELLLVQGTTIQELVEALNQIGVKPRDLIQILMAIRAAGALQAEVEVL